MTLRVYSNAKINLYLDILQRRRDGFTNIETIFQSVALSDWLEGRRTSGNLTLTCNNSALPVDEDNLVYRAAQRLRAASGVAYGASLHLHKTLPVAAGLAGGSGNAAAALCLLNRLWELDWPLPRLLRLAAKLGSDVPFCMVGGAKLAMGRGARLESCPTMTPPLWAVLAHPPIQISAGALYADPNLTHNTAPRFAGKTASFRRALRALKEEAWETLVFNRMESAAFALYPELAQIKAEFLAQGCLAAAMSGSGPTVFGLCKDSETAHAIAARLSRKHVLSVAQFAPRGLHMEATETPLQEVQV